MKQQNRRKNCYLWMILMKWPFHTLVDGINPTQKAYEEGDDPNAGDCKLPPIVVRSTGTSHAQDQEAIH
jgi:hypothetical protein